MNASMSGADSVEFKAVIYGIDEHGHEILKENSEVQIPMLFHHVSEFKHFVMDFVGIDSIAEELGFVQYDVLLYRVSDNNERFAVRTQHQYSMQMLKLRANRNDTLEIIICKKIIACVKGRPGSILIVPMASGGQSMRRDPDIQHSVVFQKEDQMEELAMPFIHNDIGIPERRRKKNPQKAEDDDLFDKLRRTDVVHRNDRQQATFDELAAMLKELNNSAPVSEGKFLCGNCGKERLVCPNRNNVGRVKYFRRKHYDTCVASGGKGKIRGSRQNRPQFSVLPFDGDESIEGSRDRPESVDETMGSDASREITPTKELIYTAPNIVHSDIVYVKQEWDS
ncbi:uncharacterized protein LOC124122466 isoform X1 [Haliotis rufescens]|uniref:uncharacterized protein LOC124122466 isoform X1 n=1 Tax=Haliotis rufescens TaxID=6454 RepID=UPI00201EE92A|nr:uncharacterized protein LOC124122466 isoform X1 [Haliotis rufescens]